MSTEPKKKQSEPGEKLTMGMTMGICIGVALGIAFDNIGTGIAIGVAIGAGMGAASEKKAQEEGMVRELTPKEKKKKKTFSLIALSIGTVLAICIGILYLMRK